MTEGHSSDELKRMWQAIEHLRDDVYGDGATGGVASHLQRLADGQERMRADVLGVKEEVRAVKEQMKTQNGSINEMKLKQATAQGAMDEREKWEIKQAGNMKWFAGFLVAATAAVVAIIDKLNL